MYVFPGIGLGSILCKAVHITDEMVNILKPIPCKIPLLTDIIKIYASAVALNKTTNEKELESGMLYPEITRIREVSVTVAREVIRQAQRQNLDREKSIIGLNDAELDAWIRTKMYDPAAHVEGQTFAKFPGGKSLL
jgi:malate dehydrogenase (oxaloacetate-decarboxylating)(NADP+)